MTDHLMAPAPALTVVGTGIRACLDTTLESRSCIEHASMVLYLVADEPSGAWIEQLNPAARSLSSFYELGKPRFEIYEAIIDEILGWLRRGSDVCVAFYGHPGFYAFAGHEAIKRARLEGFRARMLAGISCEDQMYSDLGLDPGSSGCQTYEATSFLVYRLRFEPSAALVLLQMGVLGEPDWPPTGDNSRLHILVGHLQQHYGPHHEVVIYEASPNPEKPPRIERVPLSKLHEMDVSVSSTLYVPPKGLPPLDLEMLDRLKIKVPSTPDQPGDWAR
jgi:Tetrapyrrole (Corrin/Porphyrin) Methylases